MSKKHRNSVEATSKEDLILEIESLLKKMNTLEEKNKDLEAEKEALKENHQAQLKHAQSEYDRVVQAFLEAQRNRFGKKSERFVLDDPESGIHQQPLFEFESDLDPETKPEDIELITYTRKKSGKKKPNKIDDIPVREIIIPVQEEDRQCECGCQKEVIKYEKSSRFNFIPAKFEMLIEKREVVACRNGCDGSIKTAPKPAVILPKVRATESLLAYIAISKVLDRQPLYHIEKKLDREHHWNIPRQTMAKWLIRLADPLNPLLSLMKDVIIDYDIAHVDATGLQVLNEPNRPAESKSYAYCIRGGPPDKQVILFDYTAYNNQDYIVETFEGFEGVIHSDAASVYNKIGNRQEIQMSYCHAHARRKFETVYKAIKKKGGLAKEALIMYKALYKLERFATDQGFTPQKRYELRQEKSKPILTKHKQWLQDNQAKTMPKSPIGKAIAYSLNYWDELQVFLTDGRLEIDNNSTERQIKYFVMGRKNFMFACTPKCADSLGLHFSLILTAKQHGLDPYKYYVHIFKKIPYCKSFEDYEKLLPWNCKGIL